MRKGNWWFKLDIQAWLTDENLSGCSLETQGFWLRCICQMHKAGSPKLEGSLDQIARMVGCFPEELMRCAVELKQKNAANVTLGNGTVTLLSRRCNRELSDREKTRLRVRKHRGNADVTVQSKSNKKEVRKEDVCVSRAVSEDVARKTDTILDALRSHYKLHVLRDETGWIDAIDFALVNGFSDTQFLECHDLLTKQKWRKGRITPRNVADNLPELPKLRDEIRDQNNGTRRNGFTKRTDQDVIEESADFYREWQEREANIVN